MTSIDPSGNGDDLEYTHSDYCDLFNRWQTLAEESITRQSSIAHTYRLFRIIIEQIGS